MKLLVKKIIALSIFFSCSNIIWGNVLITSIPKCGTHLVARCLEELTRRPIMNLSVKYKGPLCIEQDEFPPRPNNEILLDHVYYSGQAAEHLRKNAYKTFFIYRDPRDQIVSMAHWILKNPYYYHEIFSSLKTVTFDTLVLRLIRDVEKLYNRYLPWMYVAEVLPVKFEELVGSKGGGSDFIQKRTITEIMHHINMPYNTILVERCISHLYGTGGTFRRGKIGAWRQEFNAGHRRYFKKMAGNLLIKLGYEQDFDW